MDYSCNCYNSLCISKYTRDILINSRDLVNNFGFFAGTLALNCQVCGNAGDCSNFTDNGVSKKCDEGLVCAYAVESKNISFNT